MIIGSLSGDDQINDALNDAMRATPDSLHQQGKLTAEDVELFLDHQACLLVSSVGGLRGWWRRRRGVAHGFQVAVVKITGTAREDHLLTGSQDAGNEPFI